MLIDLGADDAQTAHHIGRAVTHIDLAGDIVKVDPLAVLPGDDALGPEDRTEDAAVELAQNILDLVQGVFLRGLHDPAGKDLVGVVMMVMMLVVVLVMVMAAAAVAVVIVVMLVVVMMMVMFVIMVLVLVVVVVMIAAVFMVMLVVVMVVLVVVVVAAAAVVVIVLFLGLGRGLGGQLGQLGLEGVFLLHGLQNLLAGELLPGGGDDGGHLVVLPEESHHVPELFVFMYILHLVASATVVKPLRTASSISRFLTARMTSDSLPTPEGSMRMRSG